MFLFRFCSKKYKSHVKISFYFYVTIFFVGKLPPKCGKLPLQNEKSVQKIRRILKKKIKKTVENPTFFSFSHFSILIGFPAKMKFWLFF